MKKQHLSLRWLPAILIMVLIFAFSSIPSGNMPDFGLWDTLVKKGGHVLGYSLLTLAYFYAIATDMGKYEARSYAWALALTLLYAFTDEFHQSFVPGRHSTWVDACFFDGGGAVIALGTLRLWRVRRKALNQKG
jgi:VanZ family protein